MMVRQQRVLRDCATSLVGVKGAKPSVVEDPDLLQPRNRIYDYTQGIIVGLRGVMVMACSHWHHVCNVSGNCIELFFSNGIKPLRKSEWKLQRNQSMLLGEFLDGVIGFKPLRNGGGE